MVVLPSLAAAVASVTRGGGEVESLSSASSLVPSAAVQRYMDMQLGMFIHFGINTFTSQQSGDGNATRHPPSAFAPTNLSTTQWISTAKALGAKYVCLTAQHEGGFALWNSSFTNYSSALPAPAGFGVDVLGDFVDAAAEGGVAPCIYFSVSCDAYHGCPMGKCDKDQWFIDMKLGQLRELLGGKYGQFAYMWTDHADGDPLFTAVTELANHLQPEMLILGQDVANIGSEQGYLWFNQLWNADNTTRSWDGGSSFDNLTSGGPLDPPLTLGGDPDGQYWKSREADKTISSSGWFWNTGGKPGMDVQGLLDLYLRSVGLGSNLILNLPPDRSGQIGADFVNVAEGFGKAVSGMYQSRITSVQNVSGETVVVSLDKNSSASMVR
jgi:alpha-L-fucosidase